MPPDAFGTAPWREVNATTLRPSQARRLARAMLAAGAVRAWRQGRRVWALWREEHKTPAVLTRLQQQWPQASFHTRLVQATGPYELERRQAVRTIAPDLELAPAWTGLPATSRRLVIEALTAFGAGDHPSTLLNLTLCWQAARTDLPPAPWLADVGTGTGILALGLALACGRPVVALDPAPAAMRALRRNQALNPLAGPLVHPVQGIHRVLRGSFALVAANLPGPILREAWNHLVGVMAPGAYLVVSGFRVEMVPQVRGWAEVSGLDCQRREDMGGWSGLMFRR